MRLTRILSGLLLGAALVASTLSHSGSINTSQIISRTSAAYLNCADYSIVGVCFWLKCGWSGCKIRESVMVRHYVPDIVVQTYRDAEDPPWTETRALMTAAQSDHDGSLIATILSTMGSGLNELGGGGGTENKAASHSNMTFTLTDSWGHPMLAMTSILSQFGYVCSPRLTAMYPYYISNLDIVAWRFGIPEMFYPQSISPVGWELGSLTYNWGPYYPRIGHVNNHDVLKESGLIAFRSVHFISRRNEPHVYRTIAQSNSRGFWAPGSLTETSGKWQQIEPRAESSCHYLPMSMGISPSDGKGGYRANDAGHVWNFWRQYRCCQRRGSWIGSIYWG